METPFRFQRRFEKNHKVFEPWDIHVVGVAPTCTSFPVEEGQFDSASDDGS